MASTYGAPASSPIAPSDAAPACRDPRGTYPDCPLCGSVEGWLPEHAHFRCRSCGFRDSCCD